MKSFRITGLLLLLSFSVSFGQGIYIQGNNPTCYGGSDGSMELILPAGSSQGTSITYPIFLSWSNGGNGFSISNLSSGNYSLTLTDGNGFEYIFNQTLFDPLQPTIDTIITQPSNFTSFDGSIQVANIISPYNTSLLHVWNTGDTSLVLESLQAGAYYLSLTDNHGCNTEFHISLQPAPSLIQEIVFTAGWHLFSIHKVLVSLDLDTVLADISDNLIILKSFNGQVWLPGYNINQLGDYTITHGYQVKMADHDTLRISGNQIDPTITPISLLAGWNIIPYLRYLIGDVSIMFNSLLTNGNLIVLKDEHGNIIWPQYNVCNISELKPGDAYFLKLHNNQIFVYPENKYY